LLSLLPPGLSEPAVLQAARAKDPAVAAAAARIPVQCPEAFPVALHGAGERCMTTSTKNNH